MIDSNVGARVILVNGETGVIDTLEKLTIRLTSGEFKDIAYTVSNNGACMNIVNSDNGYDVKTILTKEEYPEYFL